MMILNPIVLITTTLVLVLACKQKDADPDPVPVSSLSAKVNDSTWQPGSVDVQFYGNGYNITGTRVVAGDTSAISLNVYAYIRPGEEYTAGSATYKAMQTAYWADTGAMIVQTNDAQHITGTFWFENHSTGTRQRITEGTFDIRK